VFSGLAVGWRWQVDGGGWVLPVYFGLKKTRNLVLLQLLVLLVTACDQRGVDDRQGLCGPAIGCEQGPDWSHRD
jgi:hypothetical protein